MELKIVKCGHIIEIVKISEIAKIINSVHINGIENCQTKAHYQNSSD